MTIRDPAQKTRRNEITERLTDALTPLANAEWTSLKSNNPRMAEFTDEYVHSTVRQLDRLKGMMADVPLAGLEIALDIAVDLNNVIRDIHRQTAPTDDQIDRTIRAARDLAIRATRDVAPTLGDVGGTEAGVKAFEGRMRLLEDRGRDVDTRFDEHLDTMKDHLGHAEELTKRTEGALAIASEVALNAGITKYTEAFGKQAKLHGEHAAKWAAGAAFAFLVLVIWVLFVAGFLPAAAKDAGWPAHAQNFGAKLVVASMLIYAIAWLASNYRSSKHNEIVNTHRQNALMTFAKLAEGAGDDQEARRTVITQATQAIFALQPTGYTEPGPAPPTQSLIEVLKIGKTDGK